MHSFGKTTLMKYWLLLVPLFLMGTTIEKTSVGNTLYLQHCVSCHGVDGKGDGPAAARLSTSPADLTKIAARRDGVWPAFEIMTILSGYSRNILPREDMPVIIDLLDNEMSEFDIGNGEAVLMPTKLIAIASYLESLQDPAPKSNLP
jgi:mono/diheme cytochrome c family protein